MDASAAFRDRAGTPGLSANALARLAGWLAVATLSCSCASSPEPLPQSTSSAIGETCSADGKAQVWACIHDSPRRAEARACYDEARRSEPTIGGHLIVAWSIDARGQVSTVHFDEVDSQIKSEAVRRCVAAIFYRTRWNPGQPGHVRSAVYDFQFKPQ